jgi:hypothetical protein
LEPAPIFNILIGRHDVTAMQHNVVIPILSLLVSLSTATHAAAQDSLSFTLDEVDAERPKPAKVAATVDLKQAIAAALGELHWGMSKDELLKLLKKQIQADFERRIKIERDVMRQDALYQEAQERYRRFHDNFVTFDGQKTGWDVSPVATEFTHGNGEAMLVVATAHSRDLYFFMHGKLWKWYRELTPDAPELSDDPMAAFNTRFGRGKPQRERLDEMGVAYTGATWSDEGTRVTALERGSDTCLIFEDARVTQQLVVLRHNVQPKTEKARAALAVESVLLGGPQSVGR